MGVVLLLIPMLAQASARPSWASSRAYVEYDQLFRWTGGSNTTRMEWNITSVSDSLADLRVTSYTYNITNGQVNIFRVEDLWKVNLETREIMESTPIGLAGQKNPFWIDPSVNVGSTVDAYFGTYAPVQQPEHIEVLGQNISCWKVTLNWPSATMQRWYDPATGIVIRIDTMLFRGGISMNVGEVAVVSNIAMIGSRSTTASASFPWLHIEGISLLAAGVVAVTLAYLYRKSKKRAVVVHRL